MDIIYNELSQYNIKKINFLEIVGNEPFSIKIENYSDYFDYYCITIFENDISYLQINKLKNTLIYLMKIFNSYSSVQNSYQIYILDKTVDTKKIFEIIDKITQTNLENASNRFRKHILFYEEDCQIISSYHKYEYYKKKYDEYCISNVKKRNKKTFYI